MGGSLRRLALGLVVVLALLAPAGHASHYGSPDCYNSGDAPNSMGQATEIPPGNCFGTISTRHQDGSDYYKVYASIGQWVQVSSWAENVRLCLYAASGTYCGENDPDPFGGGGSGADVGARATRDGFYPIGVTEVDGSVYDFTHYVLDVEVMGSRNTQPVMEHLSCVPADPLESETITCTMRARDDSSGVKYRVDWGDGNVEYWPGGWGAYATPGTNLQATHAYPTAGSRTIRATASDPPPFPWESNPISTIVTVRVNQAPTLPPFSCSPNPTTPWSNVVCTLSSVDDQAGVWYSVDFGDGTPPVRIPETGSVAPAAATPAPHVYKELGDYTVTVTVTDTAPAPKSATRTAPVKVQANQAPVLAGLTCGPAWSTRPVTCAVVVADDSDGVFVDLEWSDGFVQRLPETGTLPPGTFPVSRTLPAGAYWLKARPTDNNLTALSGAQATHSFSVHNEQVVSGKVNDGSHAFWGVPLYALDWADIPLVIPATGAERATLTWYAQAGFADLDLVFYDASDRYLSAPGCGALRVGTSETCIVPAGAVLATISATAGFNVNYTFRYGPA